MEWVQLNGKNIHGNVNHWSVRRSSVSRMQGSTFFFFQKKKKIKNLCSALERWARTHYQKLLVMKNWVGSKFHHNTELWTQMLVRPIEFEWNIYQDSPHLQLCYKVQEFLSKMNVEPEDFTGRIIFMSMFNDISWVSKENKQECELSAQLVSIYAKRFSPGRWSFFGPGSEKKCYSTHESKPQGECGTESQSWWCRWRNRTFQQNPKDKACMHRGGSRIHE